MWFVLIRGTQASLIQGVVCTKSRYEGVLRSTREDRFVQKNVPGCEATAITELVIVEAITIFNSGAKQ